MTFSNSPAFYDEVLKKFLYGQATVPSNLLSDEIIRPDGARPDPVFVDKNDYMLGPGRFALPSLFKVVQAFFGANNDDLPGLGAREFTFSQLAEYLSLDEGDLRISFNQAYFDDGKDDYASRVFFWSSSSFRIGQDARFVIDANGNRFIENLVVNPLGDSSGDDNFDW